MDFRQDPLQSIRVRHISWDDNGTEIVHSDETIEFTADPWDCPDCGTSQRRGARHHVQCVRWSA